MLNDASSFEKIYIACDYSDLRRCIDGLASMIQQEFKLDSFKLTLFFCSAEEKLTALKAFCGKVTDFFFYISVLRQVDSNGRVIKMKLKPFHLSSIHG
jgi:transposase